MDARLKLPSWRDALIKIHGDLFRIQYKIIYWEGRPVLTVLEKLVLVLEDRRFLRHRGLDLIACARELFKLVTFQRHGGASTIDMQFVRTVTGFKDYTLKRKLYEMLLAILIHFRYSKLQILRSYLHCAFFGSHLTGIQKAAKSNFNKYVDQLTDDEAAQLAAMLVYPKPLNPKDSWYVKVRNRADYGLRRVILFEKSFEKIPS